MERTGWTDDRLDDLAARIDAEIRELRAEMRHGFGELRTELGGLRLTLLRVGGGIMIGLVGVIAAVIARGT